MIESPDGDSLLAPLSVGKDGGLTLTGEFRMYLGPSYRPLEEFDYFRKKYGLRARGSR
jgi:hypothetical protein